MKFIINDQEFTEANYRLEMAPIRRFVISQPFPPKNSFSQFVSDDEEYEIFVEVTAVNEEGEIFSLSGPVTAYYVSFEQTATFRGDMEFMEVAYTELEFK